jgi:cytochrome c biogenesis protein CcmG/thiol:disulfide interchange protein DsbE
VADASFPDATAPESAPPLRVLPRGVQVGLIGLVIVAIVFGIVFFNGQNHGLTEPVKTLPATGDRIAALPVTTQDGTSFDWSTLNGKPVWINFWASWCGPCKAEMPDLQQVYQQARAQTPDLVLLLVDTNDAHADGLKYYQDLRMQGTLVFNDGSRDVGPYRIMNFPTHLLVDRTGIVRQVLQESLTPEKAQQELRAITR